LSQSRNLSNHTGTAPPTLVLTRQYGTVQVWVSRRRENPDNLPDAVFFIQIPDTDSNFVQMAQMLSKN